MELMLIHVNIMGPKPLRVKHQHAISGFYLTKMSVFELRILFVVVSVSWFRIVMSNCNWFKQGFNAKRHSAIIRPYAIFILARQRVSSTPLGPWLSPEQTEPGLSTCAIIMNLSPTHQQLQVLGCHYHNFSCPEPNVLQPHNSIYPMDWYPKS